LRSQKAAGHNLEDNFQVPHGVTILLAIVGDGHQLATTRASADMLDNQPHEAGDLQANEPGLQRRHAALRVDDLLHIVWWTT
jgi:hypothetical protein